MNRITKFSPAALALVAVAAPDLGHAQARQEQGVRAPQARPAPAQVAKPVTTSFQVRKSSEVRRPKPLYPEVNNPAAAFASGFLNRWMGTGSITRLNSAIYRWMGNEHEARMQEAMAVCAA